MSCSVKTSTYAWSAIHNSVAEDAKHSCYLGAAELIMSSRPPSRSEHLKPDALVLAQHLLLAAIPRHVVDSCALHGGQDILG